MGKVGFCVWRLGVMDSQHFPFHYPSIAYFNTANKQDDYY